MDAVRLFHCEKLKARITLDQCNTNRSRPDITDEGGQVNPNDRFMGKNYRPSACNGCTDFEYAEFETFKPEQKPVPVKVEAPKVMPKPDTVAITPMPEPVLEPEQKPRGIIKSYKMREEVTIVSKSRQTRYPAEFKAKIVELYTQGQSVAGLAMEHDVTPSIIYKWIEKAGVALHNPKKCKDKTASPNIAPEQSPAPLQVQESSPAPLPEVMPTILPDVRPTPDANHALGRGVPPIVPNYAEECKRLERENAALIKENTWLRKVAATMLNEGVHEQGVTYD